MKRKWSEVDSFLSFYGGHLKKRYKWHAPSICQIDVEGRGRLPNSMANMMLAVVATLSHCSRCLYSSHVRVYEVLFKNVSATNRRLTNKNYGNYHSPPPKTTKKIYFEKFNLVEIVGKLSQKSCEQDLSSFQDSYTKIFNSGGGQFNFECVADRIRNGGCAGLGSASVIITPNKVTVA